MRKGGLKCTLMPTRGGRFVNADAKKNWLWGLRSGLYPPAPQFSYMKDGNNKYCPFGVLVESNGHEFVRSESDAEELLPYCFKGSDHQILPPYIFLKKVGLSSDEVLKLVAICETGPTFDEIAEYVEETL
jgi:hypothetical protein